MKKILTFLAIAILSCATIFAQETVKITKIDTTSKGIEFGKKKGDSKDVIEIIGKKTTTTNPISIDLSKYEKKEVKIDFYCDILIEGSKNSVNEVIWVVNDFNSGFPEIAKSKVKTGEWSRMSGSKFVSLTGKRQLYIPGNKIDLKNCKIYIKNLEVKITGDNLSGKEEQLKYWLDVPSLKDSLSKHFDYFGLAVTWNNEFETPKIQEGVKYHANSITMGNEFKPDFIFRWSVPKTFKDFKGQNGKTIKVPNTTLAGFATCEQILQAAKDNGLKMRGHVLVWHSQTPHWFFTENYSTANNAKLVDKETMNARMEWYIKTVLEFVADWEKKNNNGKRIITNWDVVNEACADGASATKWLREDSDWFRVYGNEEFIVNAFRYANKYAPKDVNLVYNDYNCYAGANNKTGGKTNAILKVIDAIQAAPDARIDAVGMQAHVQIDYPSVSGTVSDSFEAAIKKFVAKGLNVQVTELDIANNKQLYSGIKQKQKYHDYFEMFIKNKKTATRKGVEGVTIWGITDNGTWLNALQQYKGHKQYPLLFTEKFECKPAFHGILEAAKK